ncbi:UNVERIFIED_CONTAM: Retrovirus-related Pol polyprotein from transposon TNT 1-94 [Sesamum radiatum]|uniref:Retrovirus-related Pol polyprotein from transposon TNT 1-94 n=1 Tax=Sesamum radiatum TaxID=300843 RepID=A0AAW2VPA2_SESRA
MKDMGEASYVIGIKIHRDRSRCILGLSQETYINKVLERFRMKDCSPSVAPIVKGDKLHLNQCPRNDLEREQMKDIPYASAIGSLMYVKSVQDLTLHLPWGYWEDIRVIRVWTTGGLQRKS